MTSTLPPLVQAVSGAVGSATANAVSYPLDLVATRLQTTTSSRLKGFRGVVEALRHILRTEGWGGLYDGLGTDTAATIISNFLYFYFYSYLRTILLRRNTRLVAPKGKAPLLLSVPEELGIGFIAGIASRAISTPLSVITVRLQTASGDDTERDAENGETQVNQNISTEPSVVGVIQSIWQENGWEGFWGGFTSTIPLCLNPAITLFLFQLFGRISARSRRSNTPIATPGPQEAFFGAAFSNVVATALLYPLMLAKTRLQVQRKRRQEQVKEGDMSMLEANSLSPSMMSIWSDAYERNGWSGVYQGLEAQIVKGFVNQGVTMMVKQRVELIIVAMYLSRSRRGVS